MIEKISIYILACLIMCLMIGSVLLFIWKMLSRIMEKKGFIRLNYVLLKIVILFFLIPLPVCVLRTIMWDGITFEVNEIIGAVATVIVTIWGIGFGISVYKSRNKEKIFLDLCQSGEECGEEILKTASELMKEHKIKTPVEIYCNPWILTPMVYGIKNKKILLPTQVYTTNELTVILLHELIHIKHKDIFWKMLCRMILHIYWFYPIRRKLFEALNEWSEVYCDFSVINEIGSKKQYFTIIYHIMVAKFQFEEQLCSGIGECNLERRMLIAKNIKKMNAEKWLMASLLSLCFIMFGGISIVTATESMRFGYRALEENTSKEVVVDGTPEVMDLKVHNRYGYDQKILHAKYAESKNLIYGLDFVERKERVQTKWIYLKQGEEIFFKVFDMTDGATKMRKLQVGIMDSSKHVKYVEQAEEIDYKFKISKNGKYQCFISNYNDQRIELLGEIEILKRGEQDKK